MSDSWIPQPIKDVASGVSNAGNKFLDSTVGHIGREGETFINDIGVQLETGGAKFFEEAGKVIDKTGREIGRGLGEITGKNTYEKEMQRTAERQEAESNRLLWERDNKMAQSREADAQAEARKRMRASQVGGRTGTILTGFEQGTSTQLGAGGGKDLLGA